MKKQAKNTNESIIKISDNWDLSRGSPIIGTVLAVQANFYKVQLDNNQTKQFLLCTRRARLKKVGQKVMVGDRVLVEEPDWQDGRGAIAEVKSRTTELQRPPVANAEVILLLFAVAEPALDPWQLSRFLIKAESNNLNLCLCLNKCDLISSSEQEQWSKRLSQWGYKPHFISVRQKEGLVDLCHGLEGKITVVAGPSGVGKSSLIKALIPELELRIGSVSGKLQRGRHTTRHVELFQLPQGGLLADSPGFNQPNLDCDPQALAYYFPEAKRRIETQGCQFSNCLHRDEPNCAVRGTWERYNYYLDFLDAAIANQEEQLQQPNQESRLKLKVKRSGRSQYEPKLQTKKYRRTTRKTRQQNLQDLYEKQVDEELY